MPKKKKLNRQLLRLLQDVETWWNTKIITLSRILELREAITIDPASEDEYIEHFSATEWGHINEYVAALKPLEEAKTTAGADSYSTLSTVIPILYCLLTPLGSSTPQQFVTSLFSDNLTKCLKTRFPDYKVDEAASLATFSDLRFKIVVE